MQNRMTDFSSQFSTQPACAQAQASSAKKAWADFSEYSSSISGSRRPHSRDYTSQHSSRREGSVESVGSRRSGVSMMSSSAFSEGSDVGREDLECMSGSKWEWNPETGFGPAGASSWEWNPGATFMGFVQGNSSLPKQKAREETRT